VNELLIKICGMTRAKDVEDALSFGAGAIGLVFTHSPRRLQTVQARALSELAGKRCLRVGLFMDQSAREVERVLRDVPLDLLQFHGGEDNAYCKGFGLPFIKAISMRSAAASAEARRYPDARGLLLDSHQPGQRGGTGEIFDWRNTIDSDLPLWLAGGLTPDNVAEAVHTFKPFAIDVSSGVEETPGIKSTQLMRDFIIQAKRGMSH